jgi:hypothetical protein
MIAQKVRRYLVAATIATGLVATVVAAAPLNLASVMPTDLQIVVPEAGSSKLVIATNPGFFGINVSQKIGMDTDVKGDLSIATLGLPTGLSLTIDSAKVTWKAEEGYILKLTLKAEHDEHLIVSSGDYHVKATVTNAKNGFQTEMTVGLLHDEPIN